MRSQARSISGFVAVATACGVLVGRDVISKRLHVSLTAAIETGDLVGVTASLARGADPNALTLKSDSRMATANQTMLTFAVMKCSPEIVRALIASGAKVNLADPDGRTPLVASIDCQNEQIARLLLSSGADPRLVGANRFNANMAETPMEAVTNTALSSTNGAFSQPVIRQARAEVKTLYHLLRVYGVIPTVTQALDVGDTVEAQELLASGADINGNDNIHGSTLAVAVDLGDKPLVRRLLEAGADVNYGDVVHKSAVAIALIKHDKEALNLLIRYGADLRRAEKAAVLSVASKLTVKAVPVSYQLPVDHCPNPNRDTAVQFDD